MSRYIGADKMISDTKAMKQIAEGIAIEGIIKYLEENSLIDVIEIVRCKDCKLKGTEACPSTLYNDGELESLLGDNDFCSLEKGKTKNEVSNL